MQRLNYRVKNVRKEAKSSSDLMLDGNVVWLGESATKEANIKNEQVKIGEAAES